MAEITPYKYDPFKSVAPTAPKKLPSKKKVDFSLIAPKNDKLANQKAVTKKVEEKRANADALFSQTANIAKTTGKIGQANDIKKEMDAKKLFSGLENIADTSAKTVLAQEKKQQLDAQSLLGGMTDTVKQGYVQAQDASLKDYYTTLRDNPYATEEEIMSVFPEFKGRESVLKDYYVTLRDNPDATEEDIRSAFPEIYDLPKVTQQNNIGSTVSNVLGGAYRSVVDLPQSIAESGILDNPAEALARGPVGEAIRSGAKSLFGEKAVKEYQAKEGGKSFSEVAKGMTVGDSNSKLYQDTRVAGDAIQIGTSVAQIAKSLAKSGTKKAVLNMLKEADTVGGKRAALSRGGLDTQGPLSKFFKGSRDLVKPSKRTLEATDEVVNTIKGASKDPQKLFTQISTKVSDIGSDLSSKLKTIGIKGSNLSTKQLNAKLVDLSNEIKDISPTMGKKLQVLSKNITNSADADEFRKSLQQLDDMIPENVKSGVNLSGKDQYIYNAWRAARGAGNDLLDDIANNIPDTAVKKSLKSMSNLYHAEGQISQNIGRLTPKVTGVGTKLVRAGKGLAGTVVAGKVLQELGVFD